MCGIIGYIGPQQATPIILEGLKRLEYRGYDSAGLAVITTNGKITARREVGKLSALANMVQTDPISGSIGIGHTRWATHGEPSRKNAHPHIGRNDTLAVVHNGIIENYQPLRKKLLSEGFTFNSDTDTEVMLYLVEKYLSQDDDLEKAVNRALPEVKGANAFVFLSSHEPDKLITSRLGNAGGIIIGSGQDEMFIASDIPAILEYTRSMVFLEDRQVAILSQRSFKIYTTPEKKAIQPQVHNIPWHPAAAALGTWKHFMQKEIYEQGRSVTDTIRGRVNFETGNIDLENLQLSSKEAKAIEKIIIVACGTSWHAGLVGKFMIERLARIPVEVELGSEFRYRDPIITPSTFVLSITQSGETVDTLAAMEEAKSKGAKVYSIVNVIGSQAMRISSGYILMHTGPEIGVASTKAFTASLVDLYLLGCYLGQLRNILEGSQLQERVNDLTKIPDLVGHVLSQKTIPKQIIDLFLSRNHALYLGRGINYPIALEGALKLKEISYIHAEGYPAGEMKHGPIALINEEMPVVAIATRDHIYDKMISQIEQVKARNGIVLAIATEGDDHITTKADQVLWVPEVPPLLSPVVNIIPLQLIAYTVAVERGCDVDQPRNLAKSVTVE